MEWKTVRIKSSGIFPDGQPVAKIADRFELRNYQGPIQEISAGIELDGILFIKVGFRAPDSKRPSDMAEITYTNRCEINDQFNVDRGYWFGYMLRETLRWLTLHELDESLRVDGEFVTDPHPETKKAA